MDRDYLRACPQRVAIHRAAHGVSVATEQYTRMQRLRLVHGAIDMDASSRDVAMVFITLTNAGRRAIGLPEHAEAAGGDQHT